MMANSPDSPENGNSPALQPLAEEDESMPDVSPTPTPIIGLNPPHNKRKAPPMPSLAAELGLEDSDDDENPLRDRPSDKAVGNVKSKEKTGPEQRRFSAREKGKGRADPPAVTRTRSGVMQKENKAKRLKTSSSSSSTVVPSQRNNSSTSRVPSGGPVKRTTRPMTRATSATAGSGVQTRAAAKVKGGPRRVPINSSEAAPVTRIWKG